MSVRYPTQVLAVSNVPDPTMAALIAIRHWRDKAALARFAADRHGFGDSDGGFGITYPSDLDEHDRQVEGVTIPEDHVLAYGSGARKWAVTRCSFPNGSTATSWPKCWSAWGCRARPQPFGRSTAPRVSDNQPILQRTVRASRSL